MFIGRFAVLQLTEMVQTPGELASSLTTRFPYPTSVIEQMGRLELNVFGRWSNIGPLCFEVQKALTKQQFEVPFQLEPAKGTDEDTNDH